MTINELIDAIEKLENDPRSYIGGLAGLMAGKGLKASIQKQIAALQKKLDDVTGDDENAD
ncbi:hypothetical protein BcepSauron_008 [Burkholderia phage BcepSauron]|uniref:Uncharacterized protein n=2 Tax=Sarumanvirus TaxID=2843450 RepID=A0A482ML87_9CAUD|nr:hypothetical protein H1O16_gp007 [Burkholderia phage BcepSaruman]YP_009904386.1 hypothetical protein H1O17_gp008 [Burkholderia phage BcepSauron]QBQ74388.1 hypothetical protein BcepSauron_008 [Burkholderia phage BcepSauron]QBX06420.1 hypothetical protein BcepSaruman_007 [Burkholderia phage BcepSaruman]